MMSGQLQANSSPVGESRGTMSTDSDKGNEIPESSQVKTVDQAAEAPYHRRRNNKRPDYKECGNSDSENESVTDEASNKSEGVAEDIPARIKIVRIKTRSHTKKEPQNSEKVTPNLTSFLNTGKRSHDNHESETPKPAKRGRPAAANTQVKRFEKDALGLVERFTSTFRELETTRSENQELRNQNKFLKSKLEQEQEYYKKEESTQSREIIWLESQCNKWRSQLASALDANKLDSGKHVKVPDTEIINKWNILSYNVRAIVSEYLTEQPTNQSNILESLMIRLERLLPLFAFELINLRKHILRRTVWNLIMIGIFSAKYPIWHGDSGKVLTKFLAVENQYYVKDFQHLKIISRMKSRGIAELSGKIRLNEGAMNKLVRTAVSQLKDFIPDPTGDFISDPREDFQIQLKNLITEAAELHTTMMKSKAIFLVQWLGDDDGETDIPYDPEEMVPCQDQTEADASHFIVNFVEAPALVKIGNADGEDFHLKMTLCKSSVVLGEKEVSPKDCELINCDTP